MSVGPGRPLHIRPVQTSQRKERHVAGHLQLGKSTIATANAFCFNTLCTKNTVGDSRTITIVTKRQDLLASQHRHECLGAGISVTVLVLDAEEALKLKPDLLKHGALISRVGKRAAAVGSVLQRIERNVD
ncbi:hypothetical protein HG531_007284 [Fusarium graminearum]|nr:hypothetical protein HG531_007284 [Fusarium graminearum]